MDRDASLTRFAALSALAAALARFVVNPIWFAWLGPALSRPVSREAV